MIKEDEIREYFRDIQCEDCPFVNECSSLTIDYNAPTLCNCVTGNFEGI